MTQHQEDTQDWEIVDGLYIATRGFLMRRGYCCANRCRNCPYINWQQSPTWEPLPTVYIRRMRVSPKALAGVHALLHRHQQQLLEAKEADQQEYHQRMIAHYSFLLKQWGEKIP